jgi:hypothetical protein
VGPGTRPRARPRGPAGVGLGEGGHARGSCRRDCVRRVGDREELPGLLDGVCGRSRVVARVSSRPPVAPAKRAAGFAGPLGAARAPFQRTIRSPGSLVSSGGGRSSGKRAHPGVAPRSTRARTGASLRAGGERGDSSVARSAAGCRENSALTSRGGPRRARSRRLACRSRRVTTASPLLSRDGRRATRTTNRTGQNGTGQNGEDGLTEKCEPRGMADRLEGVCPC